jgi:ElaB/YqjD/DUF883 family membrane-anchored ribosome-binding protein
MTSEEQHGAERTPEEIQAEIEQTREELGDTVEALAAKTDVKARTQDRVAEIKDAAQAKREQLAGKAREISPETATDAGQQVVSTVQQKPVPFTAVGAFAAGLLVGWLVGRR